MSDDNFQSINGYQDDNSAIATPAAQTFTARTDAYLSSVDLYFKNNDNYDDEQSGNDDTGIMMEVRNVVNNVPGNLYYARTFTPDENITWSNDASEPTIFNFKDPVFLHKNKQYALVLYTKSTKYQLAVSKYADLQNRNGHINPESEIDDQNPSGYVGGNFCYSMNGRTWSTGDPNDTHNTGGGSLCMKFKLNRCDFDTNPKNNIVRVQAPQDFNNYVYKDGTKMNNLSFVTMTPKMFTPAATSVNWKYTFNDPNYNDAKPFRPNHSYDIDSNDYNNMYIWAILNGTDELTPVISKSSLALNTQLTNTDMDTPKDTENGMQINNVDVLNTFHTQNDGTTGAGDYLSRDVKFTDSGNKDTSFNQIYASLEFQSDGAPRPDLYVNLNADDAPASENPFKNMWILIPGYDEYYDKVTGAKDNGTSTDKYNGNIRANKVYYTVDPFHPDTTMEQNGSLGKVNDNETDNRSYSERATGGDDTTAWYRYHYHLSIPRILAHYHPILKDEGATQNPISVLSNGKTANQNIYANEAKFKIVLHTSDNHIHPRVRKFLTTVNRSDENE